MYGGSIDAPRLARWLGLYFEGAGQMVTAADRRNSGVALYAATTGYFGPVTVLLEGKYYKDYQPWHASVPTAFVEFAPISYLQPPTAERIVTELPAPIFSVGGVRGRVDWRVSSKVQLFASTAYFEDDSVPTQVLRFHDPYGGAEFRWNNGSSHFFPSGGFRYEQDRNTGAMHHEIGHVEWDFTQHLPRGLSVESQGFVLIRREDLVTDTRPDGRIFHPYWTEGTAYLALKWTPHLIAAGGYEWTTRPTADRTHHFFNGSLQWNITTASSLRVFVGGNRGGLRCISGICRDFPASPAPGRARRPVLSTAARTSVEALGSRPTSSMRTPNDSPTCDGERCTRGVGVPTVRGPGGKHSRTRRQGNSARCNQAGRKGPVQSGKAGPFSGFAQV